MPSRYVHLIALLCTVLAGAALAQNDAPQHPRLLFGPADVPALREKVKNEPFKSMMAALVADIDKDGWGGDAEAGKPYTDSVVAQRAAFLYVLTGDDAYAKKARAMTEKRIADGKEWGTGGARGLALFWHGSRIALAYDMCYGAPSWDAAFCKIVSAALLKHGGVIIKSGGTGQNTSPASNWQGGRYASGGLCLLATDDAIVQADLDQAYGRTTRYLTENLSTNGKSRGWNCEGLGYNYYPMGNFVGPFGIAMARKDPAKDIRKMGCVGWTYWTTFATHNKALGGIIRPDFGDDNAGTGGEGVYGQAFYYCPDAIKPGLVWAYDRMWGMKGDKSFDRVRAGTIYSILYYPDKLAGKDPMTIPEWTAGFVDVGGTGYQTYRNGYGFGDSDVVGQLYVKLRGNKGHSGPDALSFRIQGLDTAWAVGGGRYGTKSPAGNDIYWCSQDTLYPSDPDGKLTDNGNSGSLVGAPVSLPDGSGYSVAKIAQNNVGTKNQQRWFAASFDKASGAAAVFVIGDTSDDGKFWQFCTLEQNAITTDKNTFTVTAKNGATLKGTVLYAAGDLQWKTGSRGRGTDFVTGKNNFVHFQSTDGDYLVVLTLVKAGGKHPDVKLDGAWGAKPACTVTVGGVKVKIDGDAITYPAK